MFRRTLTPLIARVADAIDELLAADYDGDDPMPDAGAYHRQHPHRSPLRSDRERRPGRLPAAPAHCLSPVRTSADRPRSAETIRL